MITDSQIVRYALTLGAIAGGGMRLEALIGPDFYAALFSYSLDLCHVTGQTICF